MQTYKLCSMVNLKTGFHSPPLAFPTPEMAIETFKQELAQKDTPLLAIKDDLKIFEVGEFVDTTGEIKIHKKKKLILYGKNVKVRNLTQEHNSLKEAVTIEKLKELKNG